jgi:hypothetical protein
MRSRMYSLILAPALLAAVALTSNIASAQIANETPTRLNIPFSFTVAGKICPAGAYIIRRNSLRDFYYVTLAGKNAPQAFSWSMRPGEVDPTDNHIVLKFDKTGNQHALRSIQYGSLVTSRLDDKSAAGAHEPSPPALGQ